MVIDTSAVLAILQDEPERRLYNERIEAAAIRRLSAANFVEASIVIEARYGPPGLLAFDRLLQTADIRLADVDVAQAAAARVAFSRYGKGRHPAGLNFGDCFAYALARVRAEPLLFRGANFSRTDIQPAMPDDS